MSDASLHIILLEPFMTGSHAAWAQGYQRHSRHRVEILSLPGRHWKWRMHGGAISLAQQFLHTGSRPDLLIATDMLDLTTFMALTRSRTADIPVVMYFHENQLVYPWSPSDPDAASGRDRHYAFINYSSALAADHLCFSSGYQHDTFLQALPAFLNAFPDHRHTGTVALLQQKSHLLPPGMDLQAIRKYRPSRTETASPPIILWNHRWEYDKDPDTFFHLLFELADQQLAFQLVVLGESYRRQPPVFREARRRLADHILHMGFIEKREAYYRWLWRADILPVTSQHDFFGFSTVEAIACGCYPLLPARLAYPEHIPPGRRAGILYRDPAELGQKLARLLRSPSLPPVKDLAAYCHRYGWSELAPRYDAQFAAWASRRNTDRSG